MTMENRHFFLYVTGAALMMGAAAWNLDLIGSTVAVVGLGLVIFALGAASARK